MINVRLSEEDTLAAGSDAGSVEADVRLVLSIKGIKSSRTKAPIKFRTELKVKGPTYSIPTLWATKETPQIKAVSRSMRLLCNFFEFILCSPLVICCGKVLQ